MSTVLEQLNKKIEVLKEGQIYEYQNSENITNSLSITNPKDYKDFFILEDLGIQKTLKSVVIETKNSIFSIYYILDSAVLSLSLEMNFQSLEITKEVSLSLITYLRVLCSKKAEINLEVLNDKLLVHFEDTVVKDKEQPKVKLKKGEKREPLKGKPYTLELVLKDVEVLDKQVLEYIDELPILGDRVDKFPILVNLEAFEDKENDLLLSYYETSTDKGSFKIVYTGKLTIQYIQCLIEIAKNNRKEKLIIQETEDNEQDLLDIFSEEYE